MRKRGWRQRTKAFGAVALCLVAVVCAVWAFSADGAQGRLLWEALPDAGAVVAEGSAADHVAAVDADAQDSVVESGALGPTQETQSAAQAQDAQSADVSQSVQRPMAADFDELSQLHGSAILDAGIS